MSDGHISYQASSLDASWRRPRNEIARKHSAREVRLKEQVPETIVGTLPRDCVRTCEQCTYGLNILAGTMVPGVMIELVTDGAHLIGACTDYQVDVDAPTVEVGNRNHK